MEGESLKRRILFVPNDLRLHLKYKGVLSCKYKFGLFSSPVQPLSHSKCWKMFLKPLEKANMNYISMDMEKDLDVECKDLCTIRDSRF